MDLTICVKCTKCLKQMNLPNAKVEYDFYCAMGKTDLVTGEPLTIKCSDRNNGSCPDYVAKV